MGTAILWLSRMVSGAMVEIMDKIIKIVLGLFIVLFVAFVAYTCYFGYIGSIYRSSLSGNYLYTCTIATNGVLTNVTLFLPVPADPKGNSPVVAQISSRDVTGVPDNMNLTLYDTGKTTLLKVSAKSIGGPAINGITQPATITFSVNVSSPEHIDTRSPVQNAAVFRPVNGIHTTACSGESVASGRGPVCYKYLTEMYAEYSSAPSVTVSIDESITGTNTWTIFAPASNAYQNQISVPMMHGSSHGWITTPGWLESGIGSQDMSFPS
ncbi:hypothetical protein [Methanoregula sp.]|uniref:hypothetical protein n=1 Tax=Methanoregula sp. TaxID=2052170 RepID=UPI003BB12A13